MCGPKFCSMKITGDVRELYAKQEAEAGMAEKAAEFREGGQKLLPGLRRHPSLSARSPILVGVRWVLTLVMVGACYSPSIPTGAPCDPDHPCPRPLICAQSTSTCERSELDAGDDATPDVAPDAPPIPGCTPTGFDVCGDGIDQDCDGADEVCAVNDLAAAAIDVTAGGSFTGDLYLARDNFVQKGCGGDGGRDLFYKITLTAPQVYYFDTFGSNFDSTVRVFPGKACTALDPNQGPSCSDDACNGAQSQLAVELPSGTSCVVIDQNAAATTGSLTFKVMAGGHFGDPLATGPRTLTGDTCNSTDQWVGSCSESGRQGGRVLLHGVPRRHRACRRVDLQ